MKVTKIPSLKSLAVVGCGHMGSALLQRWINQKSADSFYIVTPRQTSALPFLADSNVHWFSHPQQLPEAIESIVFTVKPQILEDILPLYQRFVAQKTLFISVAAGKRKAFFESYLGRNAKIVRCMPNIPVAIGAGVILLIANQNLTLPCMELIDPLMRVLGHSHWFEDENLFDQTTALTGCGPAFVFQFIESLIEAASVLWIVTNVFRNLNPTMIQGAITYLTQTKQPPGLLRQAVTSPGGMTEAGLATLNDDQALTKLLTATLKSASKRGIHMGKLMIEDNSASTTVNKEAIVRKALDLLHDTPWSNLKMMTLAHEINLTGSQLYHFIPDKGYLLQAIIEMIHETSQKSYQTGVQDSFAPPPLDQLFDLIMTRLEAIHPHKKAFQNLTYDLWKTPLQALETLPQFCHSLQEMLETASISVQGILGVIKIKAFAIVYAIILKEWLKENNSEPSDMMIKIDTLLRQIKPILTTN